MNTEQVQNQLRPILEKIKQESFMPDYQDRVTDEQLMGLVLSKFFEWDGQNVLRAAQYGLEDSNFHGEVKKIGEIIKWAEI